MCVSKITIRKFIKLMLQIYLYKLLLYPIFLMGGYESLSFQRIAILLMPVWGFGGNFVDCFIVFWLSIPFLTILVQNLNKRQHQLLLVLSLGCYTLLGTIPTFQIHFNYITWFCVIFFIASYIRLYPHRIFDNRRLFGWLTVLSILLALLSTTIMHIKYGSHSTIAASHYFVCDCNKLFAVMIAVFSFLWFKNLRIKYNVVINTLGAGTFGVLLIHANSDAMRTWLWQDTIDALGHYALPFFQQVLFSIVVIGGVFIICNLIDQIRIHTLEKWFFQWYDNKVSAKAEALIQKVIQ